MTGGSGIRRVGAPVSLAAALLLAAVMPARAAPDVVAGNSPLTSLQALKEMEAPETDGGEEERARKRRGEAQRLAALSWASQAGLAHRGREIAALLEKRSKALSQVFDFRALLLDRGGFQVMPPILAETRDAIRIEPGRAASARRVLRIAAGERIVGAPPVWRDWLERGWEAARPPASVLFPRNAEERRRWNGWLEEGWKHGVRLADDIHASDLERLVAAFEGVVRWHRLRKAAMVSAPATETEVTAVSGHERLLRISETVVRLGARSAFNLLPREWRPLPAPAEGSSDRRARP